MSPLQITSHELKAARALLGWSQQDLASASGVATSDIARLELGDSEPLGAFETCSKLAYALEEAGICFIADGEIVGGGAGVRFRKGQSASMKSSTA